VTGIGAQLQFSWFGLIERVTIGSFILWVLVFSIFLLQGQKQAKE
jgi:cell division protein FtsL